MAEETVERPQPTWVDDAWSQQESEQLARAIDARTFQEQIYGLIQLNYYGIGTTLIITVVVASLFLMRDAGLIGYWLGYMLLVAGGRFLIGRRFFAVKPTSREALSRWGWYATVGTGFQGLGWALLVPVAWATGNPYTLAAALFIAAGFGFGSLGTLASFIPAFLAFSLPIYVSATGIFLLEGTVSAWLVAVIIGLFCALMTAAAVTAARVFRSSLLARHQNRALIRTLSEEKERIHVTLEAISDGVIATDTAGRVTYVNSYAEGLTGWDAQRAGGRSLAEVLTLINETSRAPVRDLVERCLEQDGVVTPSAEIALLDREGGREFSVEVSAAPIRDYERRIIGVVIVVHDVTDLRKMARIMSYQANHDPLTGLVNRREFERRLVRALETVNASGGESVLCYLDLDQFKVINDTCGHVAGDRLLGQLTALLKNRIRDSDTLARIGGDEFGVLLSGCSLVKAREIAEEMRDVVQEFRFSWEERIFTVGVSIGLAPINRGSAPADILAAADAACYVAKDQGRNRVHVFDPDDVEVSNRHGEMQLTSQIQRALDEDRFQLRYQKILALQSEAGRCHAEILLTMLDEHDQPLAPGVFLPAAERYSMMTAVDRWVVSHAFEQLAHGARVLQDVEQLAINLSGQSLSNEAFLDFVIQRLDSSGVDPQRICFEITETAAIANLARAQRFIRELRGRGCRFALDDFGSGLSSFAYLRQLPVDYLKIDGAFVRNMTQDAIDRAMVVSINDVGHVMGIETIAEFVEDQPTLELLRDLGVDYAQGYGIHRPEVLE